MILKITTASWLLLTSMLFIPGAKTAELPPEEPPIQTAPVLIETDEEPETHTEEYPDAICTDDCPLIEARVREYFADIPIMIEIARCESTFQQYEEDGRPLMNRLGSSAMGVFQIMFSIHNAYAEVLELDIQTLDGNMAYARYLYETQGVKPWEASQDCWGGTL